MEVRNWLLELGGDGSMDSVVINGDLDAVRKAFKKEHIPEYIEDLDEENYWDMYGVFYMDLEQSYIRLSPIHRGMK
jgi:hypothetical protein